MAGAPPGRIAMIFVAQRTHADAAGHADAAAAMEARAAAMPGYCGIDAVRDANGLGITVTWWRDEAAAKAWRDDPDHARIRALGRGRWYDWYRLTVAPVERGYEWQRDAPYRHPDDGREPDTQLEPDRAADAAPADAEPGPR